MYVSDNKIFNFVLEYTLIDALLVNFIGDLGHNINIRILSKYKVLKESSNFTTKWNMGIL